MTESLRGLAFLLLAVALLLQVADAKSCKDDLDCPLKQCCTGNSSRAGVCSPLFVNGKQLCPSCKGFPRRQLACPAGTSVCCDDGVCRKKASDCKCSSDGQCPLHTCCTGTYEKPGYCSPQAYVNGTYVCKDCQSRAGLYGGGPTSCPPDASVCCADGTCAKTATQCKCNDVSDCAPGYCCTGNYTSPGVCTTQRIVNGKQTCADCQSSRSNGAPCPADASVCCATDGTCAKSVEGCSCSYTSDCGDGYCCTGDYVTPGKCRKSAFVGGKQVCKDCNSFPSAGFSCPAGRSYCCADGTCQASLQGCNCKSNGDCNGISCCTGNLTTPGKCVLSAYANGTQKCPSCQSFFSNSQTCPPERSVCCSDGTCQATLSACGCRSQGQCPLGFCCDGDKAKPGKCVAQAFVGGKQVCKGCASFKGRLLACPKSAKYCCRSDRTCSATLAGCPCNIGSDCPKGSCCTGNSSVAGVCSAIPFKNGKQVCASCQDLGEQNMACPASASVCCNDGSCKASLAGCSCKENYECPANTCCTATNGTLGGVCSPSLFVRGKQVCPKCNNYNGGDLACPANAPFCCPDGKCKANPSLCGCTNSYDCPANTCCRGVTHSKAGTCTPQPFVNGTQVCPDCGALSNQGLSCPPNASYCCSDGTCKASLLDCKCTSDNDCEYGSCCTSKGTCSQLAFSKGFQICANCTTFTNRNVACPSTAAQCCANGLCKAKC